MIISFLALKKISPLSNRISKNSDSNLIQKARKNTASFQNSIVLLFLQYYESWQNYLEIVAARLFYIYLWMISIPVHLYNVIILYFPWLHHMLDFEIFCLLIHTKTMQFLFETIWVDFCTKSRRDSADISHPYTTLF